MRALSLLPMLLVGLLASTAVAGPPGHYDKDAITASSQRFAEVAGQLKEGYLPLERELSRTDGLLAELDLNLALSAAQVDPAMHKLWMARLDERSGVFGPEFEAIQMRVSRLEVDFEAAFEAALQRALDQLAAVSERPVVCEANAVGGISAIAPGFSASSPSSCKGDDVSQQLAALWDADEVLKSRLATLTAEPWPKVTGYQESAATVSVGEHPASGQWFSPAHLVAAVPEAIELLDLIDARAAKARSALRARWEELDRGADDFKEQRAAIGASARSIREFTEVSKATLGRELMAAVQRVRRKGRKAGWSDVSVCLNPSGWGACDGRDRSDDVAEQVLSDRKLSRALAKLVAELPEPL